MIVTAFLRRKYVLSSVAAVLVIAAVVAWQKLQLRELAHIGTGYAAEQTCACIFVSGRTLPSCVTDLEPLAQKLVSVRVGENEVTAKALLVGSATARYDEGYGCSLRD